MIMISEELEEALEREFTRVIEEEKKFLLESEEFLCSVDRAAQRMFDESTPSFCYSSSGTTLRLHFGFRDSDVTKNVDIEEVLNKEIDNEEEDHLLFILEGFERMADRLRTKLLSLQYEQ